MSSTLLVEIPNNIGTNTLSIEEIESDYEEDYDIISKEDLLNDTRKEEEIINNKNDDVQPSTSKVRTESLENIRLEHNQKVLEDIVPGDLLEFKRNLYSHWAVYIGNNKIIHLYGENEGGFLRISGVVQLPKARKAQVLINNFWDTVNGSYVYRNNSLDNEFNPLPVDQILANAFNKVNDTNYNIFWYNCEHFAKYCRYGIESCDQTIKLYKLLKFGYNVTKGLRALEYNCKKMLHNKS